MALKQPGTYKAKVDKFEMGESRNGHPQMELVFKILEGRFENETIRHWVYFVTPENSKISFDTLKACGWDGVLDGEWNGLGTKAVELVVEFETYNGTDRLRVKYVNDPDSPRGGGKRLDENSKSAFLQTLAALSGGEVVTGNTQAQQATGSDDDIPF